MSIVYCLKTTTCENIRFSSLCAAGDVSFLRAKRPHRRRARRNGCFRRLKNNLKPLERQQASFFFKSFCLYIYKKIATQKYNSYLRDAVYPLFIFLHCYNHRSFVNFLVRDRSFIPDRCVCVGVGGGLIFQLACKKCEDGRTCFRCRISKCEQNDENYSYLDNFIDR